VTATRTEQAYAALSWDGERLRILDQTLLPAEERIIELAGAADTADAIRRLAVRGAPNIGIAAAYALAMEVTAEPGLEALERGAGLLRGARPTGANLGRAVDRVRRAALEAYPDGGAARMAAAARAQAEAIHAEENEASARIAEHGAEVLAERAGRCSRVPASRHGSCTAGGSPTSWSPTRPPQD
jgi:methylthioribose-1-phosphate isomerase